MNVFLRQTGFGVDLTDPLAQNYGDGAAAAVISSQNLEWEFRSYHFETYAVSPRPGGTLIANIGEVRPLANPDLAARAGIENKAGAYLVLDDPLFDEVAGQTGLITDSLARAVKKAGLDLQDLQLVVTRHVGHLEPRWKQDLRTAGLLPEVCQNFRNRYGDTGVADLLIDLAEFDDEGSIAKGSVVALWAPCVGVQLAALILRRVDSAIG